MSNAAVISNQPVQLAVNAKIFVAEFIGSAFLLAIVVGSGIMAERLAAGNIALALLANALATGAGLIAIIFMMGSLSGAHFNPVVSLSAAMQGQLPWKQLPTYWIAQCIGALCGVMMAHGMFELPALMTSQHVRTGWALWGSEVVASFGLIAVIISTSRTRPAVTPWVVAAYIVSAYWFTSSTSFANPAVTLARAFSDTFAGIAPTGVLGFMLAQVIGAVAATWVFTWLYPNEAE